jgi:hypothetical protein
LITAWPSRNRAGGAARDVLAIIRSQFAALVIAATPLAAAGILVIAAFQMMTDGAAHPALLLWTSRRRRDI